ncbi:hypothetical protein ACKFKF_15200 [Phormidesmis sp. 146-12]
MEFSSLHFRSARLLHSSQRSLFSRIIPFLACLAFTALMVITRFPISIWFMVAFALLITRFSVWVPSLTIHPWFRSFGGWRMLGAVAGAVFFAGITLHADPATAQLFNSAEQQANSIFGQYIDSGIITFLFGLLRIVVWISAVGFVLFAVYQAQRGEQWQPLMQNAFIVVAAVVVVEGLSAMFFGGSTTATPRG